MKTLRPEDFVLSPEEIEAMKKSPKKSPAHSKPKRGIEFYQFPSAVVDALVQANYAPALAVAAAVYESWFSDFKKQNPVKLTSAVLAKRGISRGQKSRALRILEQTDLFLVERFPGHNPLVTMKWILTKD